MGSAGAHSESTVELVNMIYMRTGSANTSSSLHLSTDKTYGYASLTPDLEHSQAV